MTEREKGPRTFNAIMNPRGRSALWACKAEPVDGNLNQSDIRCGIVELEALPATHHIEIVQNAKGMAKS